MSRYVTLTYFQIFSLALVLALLTAVPVTINTWYMFWIKLPVVHLDKTSGTCIKVENFENGHAFNCNDVNVLLRQYRRVVE